MTPHKVDFADLDTSEDGSGDILFSGKLFSGIAYEYNDTTGALKSLAGFDAGRPHGPWRSWYDNGQLEYEHFYWSGLRHGSWAEWYEDGRLKLQAQCECGIFIRRKRWDATGDMVEDITIDPLSSTFTELERRRTRFRCRDIDIDVDAFVFVE